MIAPPLPQALKGLEKATGSRAQVKSSVIKVCQGKYNPYLELIREKWEAKFELETSLKKREREDFIAFI